MTLTAKHLETLKQLLNHRSDDFIQLARIAGLRLERDFRHANLRGVDFGTADTSGWDFSASDLSYADLSRTRGTPPVTAGARTEGTRWPITAGEGRVFISYAHHNRDVVDRLAKELRDHGVQLWLDRNDIEPGMRWRDAIKRAIRGSDFFIACFSTESNGRDRSYMNEELALAIDQLRSDPLERRWFIPVLLDKNTSIPNREISATESLNDIHAINLYDDWNRGVTHLVRALRRDTDPVLARVWSLINIADLPFETERLHAIQQLGAIGATAKPALSALIKAAKENNLEIQKASLEALAKIGPDSNEVLPALTAALNDPKQDVRAHAADALGKIGSSAVPALAAALKDPDGDVRRSAAGALGNIGPNAAEAVPALVAALNDPGEDVRRSAADALAKIEGERSS